MESNRGWSRTSSLPERCLGSLYRKMEERAKAGEREKTQEGERHTHTHRTKAMLRGEEMMLGKMTRHKDSKSRKREEVR